LLRPVSLVTGATGGLGYATAEGLARAGHLVVLTGRSAEKGAAALARLRAAIPGAAAEFRPLDVASLEAVAGFAASWRGRLDVLVNNAGVMAPPLRQVTEDGFERQLGTNYLGHFALTLRLLPALLEASRPRVVNVSSLAHRRGRIRFDDLQSEREYRPMAAYQQSKLAMLMFARELQRLAAARGWPLLSLAAHPGWSATRIVLNGMGQGLRERVIQAGFNLIAQSAADGARPILFAALDPNMAPGGYYGPGGVGEVRGPPAPARVMPQAADAAASERLWSVSEALTGVALPAASGQGGAQAG
jgi:NAD(P)-dependent dehydrogenase (short-subunit alcohol dehydrogenase family)